MKLLSIKAHGFKSFADKIEINVGDGITGIVGPNGSGKSNVVDAVKWVLGETSLKEIRGGDSMTDVIFAGSSSRKPLTRAWVSLTFDNSDHYLATDFDEVEIKREVYKTGENEYYINNTKVRKKDITDLFLDSGANADSFSIISQGRISEILKGKPNDRRIVIEEAAGVLKYKKRKEETMRKLDNTNDNLEKVNLVIDELEVNLEPLRQQAEVATKYVNYKEELKGIEIALLASDIKNINSEYTTSKAKLDTLNQEILTMDNSNLVDVSKLENLKTKSIKLDEEISKQSDELIKLNAALAELETRKQVISERKKYEVEDQKLESNILILKENEIELKKNIKVLENEIKSVEDKETKIAEELAKLNEEYRVMNMKKTSFASELANKNREELNLTNKIDALNDILENDTKLPYAVKSVLNNPRLSGIHDALCKLIETEEKYTTAIEIALGANANVIVTDDEKSASKAISYLKDNKLGRATFFPISVIKSRGVDDETLSICSSYKGFINVGSALVTYNPLYKSIIENQLGNTIIVDNMDTMNELGKRIGFRYRIITLDGELLHTGGSMTGGINKASSDAKQLEESINEIDNDLKLVENKIFTINGEIASQHEGLNQKNIELTNLNKRLTDVTNELQGTDNVLKNETDKELEKVLDDYLKTSTDKELLVQKLNDLKSEKNDLSSEIVELENINRKANSEYNKKLTDIKDLEVAIGKMDIKLDNLLNRLSEEYELTYEKAAAEYILDLDENVARTKVNHLKRDIRDLGDVNVGSIQEYERVNTRYTFLSEQKADL